MTKPRWGLMACCAPRAAHFRNIVGHVKGVSNLADVAA